MSPTISGEQAARLCGKTPSSFDHVEPPDDVGVGLVLVLLVLDALVAVGQAVGVDADDLAAVADVVEAVALDDRAWSRCPRRGQSLTRPAGSLSWTACQRNLPSASSKHMRTPLSPLDRACGSRGLLVVGADEDLAAGDDRPAVGLASRASAAHLMFLLLSLPSTSQLDRAMFFSTSVDHVAAGRCRRTWASRRSALACVGRRWSASAVAGPGRMTTPATSAERSPAVRPAAHASRVSADRAHVMRAASFAIIVPAAAGDAADQHDALASGTRPRVARRRPLTLAIAHFLFGVTLTLSKKISAPGSRRRGCRWRSRTAPGCPRGSGVGSVDLDRPVGRLRLAARPDLAADHRLVALAARPSASARYQASGFQSKAMRLVDARQRVPGQRAAASASLPPQHAACSGWRRRPCRAGRRRPSCPCTSASMV